MRIMMTVAAISAAVMLSACGESRAASGYIPTEQEILTYEGNSLLGDFYSAEAETFVTWAYVQDGERWMYAAGHREDGSVLLLSIYSEDSSSLQMFSAEDWPEHADILGIPVDTEE